MGTRAALKHLCIALCWVLQLLATDPSRGAEWSLEPSVGLRTEYNDNIQLTTAPHPSVWGMIVSPDVKFSGATETLKVTGGLNLGFNRYLDQPQLNINTYALSLRSSYRAERDFLKLDIDSIRDSTLVSELATTGVVLAYRPRNLTTVSPSWSRALTEVTSINAGYRYTNVNYNDTSGTSLIDYQDQVMSVGMQSNLDEGKVVSVTAYYDLYETRPPQFRANTYGVQGGYDHAFSETLHGVFVVGVRRTQSTVTSQILVCDGPVIFGICFGTVTEVTSVQKENSSGYTLNAILENRSETDVMSGRLSREIYPSGQGGLVQTDRLGVRWTRQWSPTLSASVDAAAYQTRWIGGVVTNSTSRYYRVEPQLSWRLAEGWVLNAGYRYAWQKYETTPVAASANVVYLTVNYAWPKLSISR